MSEDAKREFWFNSEHNIAIEVIEGWLYVAESLDDLAIIDEDTLKKSGFEYIGEI